MGKEHALPSLNLKRIRISKEGSIFRASCDGVSEIGHNGWEAVGRLIWFHGEDMGIARVGWAAVGPSAGARPAAGGEAGEGVS